MAKSIMIQGTMSNAGKSVLVGGLCRICYQDGYRTVPFKSQNMALNSYITPEGLEMGRAQVMQAEAANVSPSVLMNPILLKPTNDMGSQVIVNGEVYGTMSAKEYFKKKKEFIPEIMKAYHTLDRENDIIILEGAGSPAEINLKQDDIVNMGMARLANAPVLLVGDIDRGGVFAQLVGTIALLEEQERRMIKGTIVNKFRGDLSILEPGLRMLEEKTDIPVRGVVPYVHLDIDEEDSLTEKFSKREEIGVIDIAVIRLPRISNFTDLNPLEYMEEVSLRYVQTPGQLRNPDMIVIPGTKNTIEDLLWLRQSGLEAKILQHVKQGKLLFGICGGYQMLGESIEDPDGMEAKGKVKGLGLLPMHTVFQKSKTRTQISGIFEPIKGILKELSGLSFEGYEIHMGVTTIIEPGRSLTKLVDVTHQMSSKLDGTYTECVYGSYVHGIFDEPKVTEAIIRALLEQKGLDGSQVTALDLASYKESQYNRLAEILRESLDMKAIYEIIHQGI